MDPRRLPLNAVRAFEAAARHLSLSRAAAELGVTPGAVGHQVRLLEAHLGVALFRKAGAGLALTDAGARALPSLRTAFSALAEAFAAAAGEASLRQVKVAVHPSFAAAWLLPRLADFARRHPALDVEVVGPVDAERLLAANIDAAIVYRPQRARDLTLRLLMTETMVPVCAPALLAGQSPPARPEDLLRLPLLHADRAPDDRVYPLWTEWLKAAGVTLSAPLRGARFNLSLLALQAAREGRGVALVSSAVAQEDLAAGRLVLPLPAPPALPIQRWLLTRRRADQRPAVRAFVAWVAAAAKGAAFPSAGIAMPGRHP